nr:N-acetyltransferase [Treponema socranskii]
MNKNDCIIRLEKKEEYRKVENLVRESFWNVYRPGCQEHYILQQLRNDPAFVHELDFVMEKDGKLIGQNIFVRAMIKADNGNDIPIMTMGPICITPALQRKGYGKILLDYSLEKAKELGCGAVCFEGTIDFYGKSGFSYASAYGIRYHGLPEGADASFFLCKELIPGYLAGITGEYAAPKGYSACDEYPNEFAVYEAGFPYKEKRKLSGQIFD